MIRTKASIQSFFERGDRPTSAQFTDWINSSIFLVADTSTVRTGIYEVESTASTTNHSMGTFAKGFLPLNTTAQAQAWMAFTSASGAGGGEFGTDWLDAATTAVARELLGDDISFKVLSNAGETLYTDGSGLQALSLGTTGQSMFSMDSSAPSWRAPVVDSSAQAGDGTDKEFTSIPSWVRRITVTIDGMSTNGTSLPLLQLGHSGGYVTSGYTGAIATIGDSSTVVNRFSEGFTLRGGSQSADQVVNGMIILTRHSSNIWAATISLGRSDADNMDTGGGTVDVGAVLTQLKLTTVNGTDAYDAGTFNIHYE